MTIFLDFFKYLQYYLPIKILKKTYGHKYYVAASIGFEEK